MICPKTWPWKIAIVVNEQTSDKASNVFSRNTNFTVSLNYFSLHWWGKIFLLLFIACCLSATKFPQTVDILSRHYVYKRILSDYLQLIKFKNIIKTDHIQIYNIHTKKCICYCLTYKKFSLCTTAVLHILDILVTDNDKDRKQC